MKNTLYILFFFFGIQLIGARTIQVGSKFSIKNIKKAIKLSNNGDTIIVNNGIYKEGNKICKYHFTEKESNADLFN